jgi:3-hydroxy acid dehydrogenase/malonic semialdehyde reductase
MKNQKANYKKVTLITGAGSGIGEATAYSLSRQKHNLVLIGRRLGRLRIVQKKCLSLGAASVLIFKADINNLAEIKKINTELKKKKLKVSVLINNAGLAKGVGLFQDSTDEDNVLMLDTNVKALLRMTRQFLSDLIATEGHIVNLGSVAGRLVYEGGTVYCATKFAVRAISDALRLDLKTTRVRVTNIEPGMVNTEFSLVRLGNQQRADAVYENMMPLTATDIAETILWCLNRPSHVNISELVIYPTDQASVGHVVRGERSVLNNKK